MRKAFILPFLVASVLSFSSTLSATTSTLYPTDTPTKIYSTIQNAACGDTVVIQPGTYNMANKNLTRIYIANKRCGASNPLVIRAAVMTDRPLFDYTGYPLDGSSPAIPGSSPGSSSDNYRGAWQVHDSSYVTIDGIKIRGASSLSTDSVAGLRFIQTNHFTLRHSILKLNWNGLQGDGKYTTVEYTEFDSNGRTGSDQQHQFYDTGGDELTVRYSYFHGTCNNCGQNLHIRSWHSHIYGNWMENASDYEWDMMTPAITKYPAPADNTMSQEFYGNVVITNPNPRNGSKVFTFYSDAGGFATGKMKMDAQWNTFWIRNQNSYNYNLFQINTQPGLLARVDLHLSNNVIHFTGNLPGNRNVFSLYTQQGANPWSITGSNNWFDTFVVNTCVTSIGGCSLTQTKTGAIAPFRNLTGFDLRPATADNPFGVADNGQKLQSLYEQYQKNKPIQRTSFADVGALQY